MRIATLARGLSALVVAATLAGCVPVAPTAVPGARTPATNPLPTAAPSPAPSSTPAAEGKAFAFNGVQLTIPAAVASGASGALVPPAVEQGAPEFAIRPAYTEIRLAGCPAQHRSLTGTIQVFPVAEYERISPTAAQRVQAMRALLAQRPAVPDGEVPLLPVFNEAQVLRAQVRYAGFQNGSGVRFVTFYSQGLMPATNKDVFYTYQGLTADGAHWVSAILPVNVAYLPADTDSAGSPPVGGIPFPSLAMGNDAQVRAYYQAVAGKMSATPASEFTPSLEALDAMMQSLKVTVP